MTPESLAFDWLDIIAVGFIGCAGGEYLSKRYGSAKIAFIQLAISGLCCLLTLFLFSLPLTLLLAYLILWGITVSGDSPQFSTLTARTAPKELLGSALTIVISIGFAITIISIQLTDLLSKVISVQYLFTILAIGPAFGLYAMRHLLKRT